MFPYRSDNISYGKISGEVRNLKNEIPFAISDSLIPYARRDKTICQIIDFLVYNEYNRI